MAKNEFEERLWQIIPPVYLNEWEKEELIELVAGFDRNLDDLIMQQIAAIWPVSTALCFSILEELDYVLEERITPLQVPEWVREVLEVFESEGLRAARSFMADVDNIYFQRLRGQGTLSFDQVASRLLPYVRGLANRNLVLEPADLAGTDTATIFLPREISSFASEQQNFLLYKLTATFQWAFIKSDCYCHKTGNYFAFCEELSGHFKTTVTSQEVVLDHFFSCFPNSVLAKDIYHLLHTVRAATFLIEHVPGLMHDTQFIFEHLVAEQAPNQKIKAPGVLGSISDWLLLLCLNHQTPNFDSAVADILATVQSPCSSSLDVMHSTKELYDICIQERGREEFLPYIFQGKLNPLAAHRARLNRRKENKQHFIEALSTILLPQTASEQQTSESEDSLNSQASLSDDGISMTQPKTGEREEGQQLPEDIRYIRINDQQIDLPEELRDLATEIATDLGGVPASYIDSAQKIAGSGFPGKSVDSVEDVEELPAGEKTYDEWDFRRQGFRKNWCRLIERKVDATKGSFVSNTLEKYRGQIIQLKRQFEMMRTQHRFVKRQRDGDDIDIEALTVALGDCRAGHAPSDRLFIRLLRDERDIATLFLVDMSSSTEGWVGNALKESLLILCEAMEPLGDRYAIYGFSGMRRSRNIIFHVKEFGEIYTDEIKGRIAAISPMDYTRMGAPIRHFTEILGRIDAKVRLLLILTDGKPEDYDDYKGEYAIEDTRHALIEAKAAGIHPFCITIDREAQDYMGHMLGEINYTFINNVRKLPLRVPEIYRTLTS